MSQISINIWDDYYDDGFIPEGEIQETYAYVECDLAHEQSQEVLEILKNSIEKLNFSGFEMSLEFYESANVYPHLVGSEYEYILYNRWQLNFKHLTHERLDLLVQELNSQKLQYQNRVIDVYSES